MTEINNIYKLIQTNQWNGLKNGRCNSILGNIPTHTHSRTHARMHARTHARNHARMHARTNAREQARKYVSADMKHPEQGAIATSYGSTSYERQDDPDKLMKWSNKW